MHISAAASQSLHEHLLAYVKQNLPPAKNRAPFILLIILAAIPCSACATPPRAAPSAAQLSPRVTKSQAPVININTASVRELEELPGIGIGLAERIVSYREQYGPFRRAEHLMLVRGISDRRFRELRPRIIAE